MRANFLSCSTRHERNGGKKAVSAHGESGGWFPESTVKANVVFIRLFLGTIINVAKLRKSIVKQLGFHLTT